MAHVALDVAEAEDEVSSVVVQVMIIHSTTISRTIHINLKTYLKVVEEFSYIQTEIRPPFRVDQETGCQVSVLIP